MKQATYIFFFAVLASGLFTACENGDLIGVDAAVIDGENNRNKLRHLLMVINPVNADDKSVVLSRIESVTLKVDGRLWGSFPSDSLGISGLTTTIDGNLAVTDRDLGYLVNAEYVIDLSGPETAGGFVDVLRSRIALPPGDHVCEVVEVRFIDLADNVVTVQPNIYRSFRVEENVASIYIGEIIIQAS